MGIVTFFLFFTFLGLMWWVVSLRTIWLFAYTAPQKRKRYDWVFLIGFLILIAKVIFLFYFGWTENWTTQSEIPLAMNVAVFALIICTTIGVFNLPFVIIYLIKNTTKRVLKGWPHRILLLLPLLPICVATVFSILGLLGIFYLD